MAFRIIGWLIIVTGVVSSATLTVATVRFIQDFVSVPEQFSMVLVALLLGAIAAWGVRMAVGISVLQIATLLYVVFASTTVPESTSVSWTELLPPLETAAWVGVLSAAFLAFYAFVGFEDMVTMAEEVRDVRENLPWALILSLILTALLYIIVSAALVFAIPPATLAEAKTPLAAAVRHHGTVAVAAIGVISILWQRWYLRCCNWSKTSLKDELVQGSNPGFGFQLEGEKGRACGSHNLVHSRYQYFASVGSMRCLQYTRL